MANQEHLIILKQGVDVWNKWRKEYPDIQPDLRGASLNRADLSFVDLEGADLGSADLTGTDFSNANLKSAVFNNANLSGADLEGADLTYATLYKSDLCDANLRQANLCEAFLNETNFSRARVGWTILGSVDLSTVKGLGTVRHEGPSIIGIDTIYASKGDIPEAFLKGAGVDDTFITYIRSLVGKATEYYSCFISYSNKDETFARRLYADLQSNSVRCWFAREDLKIGDKFRHRIDESIRIHDKLLLILSEASIASSWVSYEVEKALDKEPEGKANVLFPIRLDKAILTCETDWAKDIRRSRHIGDFEYWKDHDAYQVAFERLLRDLKAQS